MARSNFTDLFAQAAANLADNTTGDISPEDVRVMITNLMETTQPGYSVLQITTPRIVTANDATPTVITGWDANLIQTADYTSDIGNGTVTQVAPGVVKITANITGTFSNSDINLIIQSSGTPATFTSTISANGPTNNNPLSGSVTGLYDVGLTPDTFSIALTTDGGNEDVNLTYAVLICEYVPLINPPT